jgi:hypothetical protein
LIESRGCGVEVYNAYLNIKHILCRHTWDRGTADVLDPSDRRPQRFSQERRQHRRTFRPVLLVFQDVDRPARDWFIGHFKIVS